MARCCKGGRDWYGAAQLFRIHVTTRSLELAQLALSRCSLWQGERSRSATAAGCGGVVLMYCILSRRRFNLGRACERH